MASAAEKLKIASHFILNAPHGELREVIAVVNDSKVLSASVVDGLQKQYNLERFNIARKNDDSVLICSHGQIDATHFLNPRNNMVYQVNHDTLEIVGAGVPSNASIDGKIEEYRKAVESAVQFYADGYYTEEKTVYSVYAKEQTLYIVISSRNTNLGAMWSGGWTSTYVLPIKQGAVDMKGTIRLNVHYFEDGNVQLNSTFNKDVNIRVETPENTAKAVATTLDKHEGEFHKQLEEFYVNMNASSFKAMRRFLPPSRKTFEWNSNAHKLAAEMK